MTKMNPNNGNETKSDIFSWEIFKSDIILIDRKVRKDFNDFYSNIFQFHWKLEHKQLKWNKIKRDMCKSDSIFPNIKSGRVFEIYSLIGFS